MTSVARGRLVALCLLAVFLMVSKVKAQRILALIAEGVVNVQVTASSVPTEPPPPNPTPRPTATLWLDAPHISYVQPVTKPEATPTPTDIPGTPTRVPTEPAGPTATLWLNAPHNSYIQPVMKSEATPAPTDIPGTPTPVPTEEPG